MWKKPNTGCDLHTWQPFDKRLISLSQIHTCMAQITYETEIHITVGDYHTHFITSLLAEM